MKRMFLKLTLLMLVTMFVACKPPVAQSEYGITQLDIPGITPPARGAKPVTNVVGTEYIGTISWDPAINGSFAENTAYTATIALAPRPGYTFNGVPANSFKVEGASSVTHSAKSGLVTAVFPATSSPVYDYWIDKNAGSGASSDPFIIATRSDLEYLATSVNSGASYSGRYLKMTGDIDLSSSFWTPIGILATSPFSGVLDGDNHYINNIYISTTSSVAGLFGYTSGAKISNLNIAGNGIWFIKNSSGFTSYTGSVIGYALSTVMENCSNQLQLVSNYAGSEHESNYVGGIVGFATKSSVIKGCQNSGTITGSTSNTISSSSAGEYSGYNTCITRVGGIAGGISDKTAVTDCTNSGTLSGTATACIKDAVCLANPRIGGIIGEADGSTIANCQNNGSVTAKGQDCSTFAGGVLGFGTLVNINACRNAAPVTSTRPNSFGDCSSATTSRVGGVAAYIDRSNLTDCYNTGSLSSSSIKFSAAAGGVVCEIKYASTLSRCYNRGSIEVYCSSASYATTCARVGGVASNVLVLSACQVILENCYNVGKITATAPGAHVGGFIAGPGDAACINCYNAGDMIVNTTTSPNYIGGFSGDTVSTAANVYYRSDCITGPTCYSGTGKAASEMMSAAFVSSLNQGTNVWSTDLQNANLGYPVLNQ
jgi:hypothetical protein